MSEIDYSSFLPEPTPLSRAAIVEFDWGPQHFQIWCVAATVRRERWETGEMVDWLHCKGVQFVGQTPTDSDLKSTTTALIPANYVTQIRPGPTYRIAEGKKTEDIGVFPPEHPNPPRSMGVQAVDAAIKSLMAPERN